MQSLSTWTGKKSILCKQQSPEIFSLPAPENSFHFLILSLNILQTSNRYSSTLFVLLCMCRLTPEDPASILLFSLPVLLTSPECFNYCHFNIPVLFSKVVAICLCQDEFNMIVPISIKVKSLEI